MTTNTNSDFEALLNYIKRNRGFDFTGYKRSTLMRRVSRRMQALDISSYSNYQDFLEVHPQEFVHMFNTVLINVTSFFRDQSAWDYLAAEIVPQLLLRQEPNEPIRVWSAGCASGQEAYSLAILLAEALGAEMFLTNVRIYATDLDEEALSEARQGTYSAKELADVPQHLLKKYFEHAHNDHYTFRKDLRRSVIFGRHNLVQDAPISRISLLLCRNTLMYFNAEAQAKIIARFHFALLEGGFLFLGKAEMLLSYSDSFLPIDLKGRIFTKISTQAGTRERLLVMGNNSNDKEVSDIYLSHHLRIQDAAFNASPVAQVTVDATGSLALANDRARVLLNLHPQDIGRPLQDLEISYRPVELRSCIEQAYSEGNSITIRDVEWITARDTIYVDVQVTPLFDLNTKPLGVSITFSDETRIKRLQQELEHANQELEMAYVELQSTNEELETTNEELQSSNEELETTNEELQSTNEELETMNEELQSSNEELQTINDELRIRSTELNKVNAFLESILTSMRGGVVVINRDLCVQIWNDRAEDLWGLRAEEVEGQQFLSLDIGLPVEQLLQPIRTCLSGEKLTDLEVMLEATNRRGKAIMCQVTCTSLVTKGEEVRGVILLMEQTEPES